MKYILLLLCLAGCGGDYKVSGNVTVTYTIDLSNITKYFTEYCVEKYPYDVDLQKSCADEEIAKFILSLEGKK